MEGEGDTRGEEDVRGSGAAGGAGRQIIRWERFLPRRSLRVLLVEYDDSTRHIVTALLRKCGYRVVAVADGLQAWEVLKERHYGFDLVLTEVMTPLLSGIGLLTKVMASEACRNIPVIMMSSYDSVSVVYTCMLKGAVDFLVKPIRKNELQNLWQHVWRRHCSSSYANASDNNAASNCISSNAGGRSNTRKKSDEETDAQSLESKPDSEIRSVRKPMEPNLAEQESCSRKMEEKPQQPINGMTKETNAWKLENSGGRKGKSAEIGVELIAPIREACLAEEVQNWNIYCRTSPYRNGVEDSAFLKSREDCGSHHKENAPDEPPQRVVCYVKPIANGQCSNAISEENTHNSEALCAATKVPSTKNASDFSSSSPLEFSWRRPQQNGCVSQEFKARHILIHSDASAFSRYGEKRIHPTSQKVVSSVLHITRRECDDKGHSNVHNNDKYHSNVHSYGTDDKKNTGFPSREMLSYSKGNEGEATVCFKASSGGNREEAGILSSGPQQEDASGNHASTGKVAAFHQAPLGFISLPIPVGAVPYQSLCAQYGAILHPMFHAQASLMQHCPDATDMPHKKIPYDQFVQQDNQPVHNNSSFNFQPHDDNHQSYHMRQPHGKEAGGPNSFSCTPVDPANQSGSCSQDVLNGVGRNGSGETTDATGNTGTALENGNESGIQNCNWKAAECDRACREAALIKFQLKRKDRCFEKRVRYYSRKKLAEQRPRVKGQFVRQKVPDSMAATEADN